MFYTCLERNAVACSVIQSGRCELITTDLEYIGGVGNGGRDGSTKHTCHHVRVKGLVWRGGKEDSISPMAFSYAEMRPSRDFTQEHNNRSMCHGVGNDGSLLNDCTC